MPYRNDCISLFALPAGLFEVGRAGFPAMPEEARKYLAQTCRQMPGGQKAGPFDISLERFGYHPAFPAADLPVYVNAGEKGPAALAPMAWPAAFTRHSYPTPLAWTALSSGENSGLAIHSHPPAPRTNT